MHLQCIACLLDIADIITTTCNNQYRTQQQTSTVSTLLFYTSLLALHIFRLCTCQYFNALRLRYHCELSTEHAVLCRTNQALQREPSLVPKRRYVWPVRNLTFFSTR